MIKKKSISSYEQIKINFKSIFLSERNWCEYVTCHVVFITQHWKCKSVQIANIIGVFLRVSRFKE